MKQKAFSSTTRGAAAEQAAATFLQQQGLRLITRNYRFKGGEIDLILEEGAPLLVFVEVRMRNNRQFGSGAESVTFSKQQKLSKTALHYLQHHPGYQTYEIRFDVLSISEHQGAFQFEWFKEAFWPGDQ